ncbi:MAG: hypothetical protein ACTHMW_02845 [Actinomycetes bacterium]
MAAPILPLDVAALRRALKNSAVLKNSGALKNNPLSTSKALYVAAGAGDLAVAELRSLPQRLQGLRAQADERVAPLRSVEPRALVRVVQQRAAEVGQQAKSLPVRAIGEALTVSSRAAVVVDELAERGKSLVTKVEEQPAAQRTERQAKATVRRARSTARTAKSTATNAAAAAEGAAEKLGE